MREKSRHREGWGRTRASGSPAPPAPHHSGPLGTAAWADLSLAPGAPTAGWGPSSCLGCGTEGLTSTRPELPALGLPGGISPGALRRRQGLTSVAHPLIPQTFTVGLQCLAGGLGLSLPYFSTERLAGLWRPGGVLFLDVHPSSPPGACPPEEALAPEAEVLGWGDQREEVCFPQESQVYGGVGRKDGVTEMLPCRQRGVRACWGAPEHSLGVSSLHRVMFGEGRGRAGSQVHHLASVTTGSSDMPPRFGCPQLS